MAQAPPTPPRPPASPSPRAATASARSGPASRRARSLRFRILDAADAPVTRFEAAHTKRLHLIVVRRDGTRFVHRHPAMSADGSWSARVRLPAAGPYRLFADFTRDGRQQTLGADLLVAGDFVPRARPAAGTRAVSDRGRKRSVDAELQPHLGARGHLVALRAGDLAYLHTHPEALVDIVPTAGEEREAVLRLAGALEDASEHPVARAIAAAARDAGALPAVEGFANRAGLGVEGVVDGHAVVVGRPALLEAEWAMPPPPRRGGRRRRRQRRSGARPGRSRAGDRDRHRRRDRGLGPHVSGDLRSAADAIRLARRTLATIRTNLFWAFAYNVALIPAAAAGYLNPLLAGAAMAASSLVVFSNSLRLRGFRPRREAS